MPQRFRAAALGLALVAALGLGACSNDKDLADASAFGAGAATPGSAQDFVVNIGDRVFFESGEYEFVFHIPTREDRPDLTGRRRNPVPCRRAPSIVLALDPRGLPAVPGVMPA